MRWKRTLASFVIAFFLCLVVLIAGVMYLFRDLCANTIHDSILSPGGQLKAVIFQRDCGAGTGYSTQVSVLSVGDQLDNESGNIYIIRGHPEDNAIVVNWLSDNKLSISAHDSVFVYKQEREWGWPWSKISISY